MISRTETVPAGAHNDVEFVGVPVGHHARPDKFNLEQFEYQVTQPDSEPATRYPLNLQPSIEI
ncbi:hypothetical protein FHR25_004689 [Yokenella regensburgei]|nr:hypothetical protein FHR25_004689 [Yokenella regensburgei]